MQWCRGNDAAATPLALGEMLREAKAEGLRYVEITTQPDNTASQRVITANGGVFIEEFITPPSRGGYPELVIASTWTAGPNVSLTSFRRTY